MSTNDKLFEIRPIFRGLQITLILAAVFVLSFAYHEDIKRFFFGNRHSDVVVKTMLAWGDDSRDCQLFNGNPAIQGGPRTMQEGDHLQMLCPNGNIQGDWLLTYVGTVRLDDDSERDFKSRDKYFVPVLCTKEGKIFECIRQQ